MLTDNDLLDFDHVRLHMAFDAAPRKLLNAHGQVYRSLLVAAHYLEDLAAGFEKPVPGSSADDGYMRGQARAYHDAVAFLRQGSFLPGGREYEEEINGPAH